MHWRGVVSLSVGVRSPERKRRAEAIAARLGVPLLPSSRTDPSQPRYAVSEARERLLLPGGGVLEPNEGLLGQKLQLGLQHPLAQAVGGRKVLDGTAGLLGDGLHLAALGYEVVAAEAQPVLACLLEWAVLRWQRAGLIEGSLRVLSMAAETALEHEPRFDVAYFDPMFAQPRDAAPGYAGFRSLALSTPLSVGTLRRAAERASERVVLKLPAQTVPVLRPDAEGDWRSLSFNRRVCTKAFDFWIMERDPARASWAQPRNRRGTDPCPAAPSLERLTPPGTGRG